MLRPHLLHLGDSNRLRGCYGQLFDIIRPVLDNDCSKRVAIPSWGSGDVNVELRDQFRLSLATNLYGWDELLSLRMRLSLADFAWVSDVVYHILRFDYFAQKILEDEGIRIQCGVIAEAVLNAISNRICRILIRQLVAVAGLLNCRFY